MRLSGTGFTEAEAKAKRCHKHLDRHCIGSECIGWEFGVVLVSQREEVIPEDVARAYNAWADADGNEGDAPDIGNPLFGWICATASALAADGWVLPDHGTPESVLASLADDGTTEYRLDGGDITLTFERPRQGVTPRGDCLSRHKGS